MSAVNRHMLDYFLKKIRMILGKVSIEFKEMHGHCNEHEICSGDFEMAKDDHAT